MVPVSLPIHVAGRVAVVEAPQGLGEGRRKHSDLMLVAANSDEAFGLVQCEAPGGLANIFAKEGPWNAPGCQALFAVPVIEIGPRMAPPADESHKLTREVGNHITVVIGQEKDLVFAKVPDYEVVHLMAVHRVHDTMDGGALAAGRRF